MMLIIIMMLILNSGIDYDEHNDDNIDYKCNDSDAAARAWRWALREQFIYNWNLKPQIDIAPAISNK